MVGSGGTVLRKGAWTPEEDILLRNCIEIYGEGKWYRVPLKAGLNRCRKSCRLRWLNYLKPNINRGEFQADEVDLMIRLHRLLGNRWSLIAARLPGRTSNDVKNYWNTHIQKKLAISTKEKIMKNQLEIPKTAIFKPRPRTLSKTSPWLIEKITILENDRNDSNPSDPTVRPLEKDDDNNNNNHNDNNNDDDDMWWESILDYNGKSTSSTHDFGEESIVAATMEVGDGTVKEGQLDRWIDVSFEEDPWDIFRAI